MKRYMWPFVIWVAIAGYFDYSVLVCGFIGFCLGIISREYFPL